MRPSIYLAIVSGLLAAPPFYAQKPTHHVLPPKIVAKPAPKAYRDSRFGVRFSIPSGWDFTRKDGQVSTFRLDARSATSGSQMRAVVSLNDNPYPLSTLSGALVYYSVQPHTTDLDCERQATGTLPPAPATESKVDLQKRTEAPAATHDIQNIGGMNFTHGHDEHGGICIEARDDIYTAFRKGSCYRFDLEVNTFCSETSGALEINLRQMREIEQSMTGILSTVVLDWEKSGAHPVPVPDIPIEVRSKPAPVITQPVAAAHPLSAPHTLL